jgi:hypothetical protein
MISIIITGRNDDYGGHFEQRCISALRSNVGAFEKFDIPYEVIFIEWNPIRAKPLISEKLVVQFPKMRAVIVGSDLHEAYSTNANMLFHESAAKNVGIRFAMGESLLLLNADIVLPVELVGKLRSLNTRRRVLYRARRIDVKAFDFENGIPRGFISNGEENYCPIDYLGAAGDFCYASRSLLTDLTGYDEEIRFTTRAKDWQFMANAISRGISIVFIGNVFHLDHLSGFRYSPGSLRDSEEAHFGSYWNFESRIPYQNGKHWGMIDALRVKNRNCDQIVNLQCSEQVSKIWDKQWDVLMRSRLTAKNHFSGAKGAMLMHLFIAVGHAKVIPENLNPDTQEQLNVLSRCLRKSAGVYGEKRSEGSVSVRLSECRNGIVAEISDRFLKIGFPETYPVNSPQYNPFLLVRLMSFYLWMKARGSCKLIIFGCGSHSDEIMRCGMPDFVFLEGFVESLPQKSSFWGRPVNSLDALPDSQDYCLLISSASYENEMIQAARASGIQNTYGLYQDYRFSFVSNPS